MKIPNPINRTRDVLKPFVLATLLAGACIPAQAQTVIHVGGNGTIGDTTLATVTEGAKLVAKVPKDGANWTAAGGQGIVYSRLTSPTLTVPTTGPVTLKFKHRYFFEDRWDGGAVYVSVNGADPVYVEPTAFTANGYNALLTGEGWVSTVFVGKQAFTGKSTDYDIPALMESVVNLGTLTADDTVAIQFRGGWDDGYFEATTNWEIGTVEVRDSASTALLNVDFLNGPSGFTVASDAALAGPFVYVGQTSQFEINGDTLAADRYVPNTPGANTIIDLNNADLAVVLLAGTVNIGDSFTLFDLSGGTTLRGTYNSITLPETIWWDLSELMVTGRIVCKATGLGLQVSGFDSTFGPSYLNPIANLKAVTPSGTGIQTPDINYGNVLSLPGITDDEFFSVLWEGWFDVTIDGPGDYTFATASDDGSVVFMDMNEDGDFTDPGELIVSNNKDQATTIVSNTVALTMNSVRMVIGYYQGGGGYSMAARFKKGSALAWDALQPINGKSGHFYSTNPYAASMARITSFSPASVIDDVPVANAATIAWTVRFGIADMTNLAPAFTLSAGAKCYNKNPTDPTAVEIFSGAHRDFSGAPVHYFVKSLNGLVVNDYTVTVDVGPEAPPLLVTDYARWFDASTIVAADGAPVPTWNDLSPNAAHATVPSGNATPVYVANAGTGSGLGAVYFAKNGGAGNSAALKFTRDSSIRTIFSVFKGNSFLLTDTDAYDFHRPGDDNPAESLWTSYTNGNITGGSTYVNGTLVNGTSFAMPTNLHNGFNLVEVLTTGNVQADSFNKDRIYHAGNQSQAEVLIYDRLLTEDERLSVENYLTAKWFGTYTSTAPDAKMLTFGPGATIGAVAANAATIAWIFPYGANITNLAPTFALSAGAKCYDKNPLTDPTAVELVSGTTRDFSGGAVHYFVKSTDYVDLVNDYAVTATETPPSTACRMLTFGLPGYPATIDEGAKTINWMVPFGSMGSLSPEFTVSEQATGDPVSGTTHDLSLAPNQVTYRVYAQDTNVWQDYVVTATELPVPPGGTSVGPVCWYDASSITVADGSQVNTWNDLSLRGHTATRVSGSPVISYNDIKYNSSAAPKKGVHFRGTDDYFDCAGGMFVKEQYVVVRSPNPAWVGSGSFLGRKSNDFLAVRASSHNLYSGYTGFWDDQLPAAVSRNGAMVSSGAGSMPRGGFELKPITDYMIIKVVVNENATAANRAAYPYYQIGRTETLSGVEMDVAEIIGYETSLSAADEALLGAYLADKYGVVTSYPETTPQALIRSFAAAGLPATIDQARRVVVIDATIGTDVSALVPSFTLSDGATCTVNGSPLVSDVTPLNFRGLPVHCIVTSSDALITADYTLTIRYVSPLTTASTALDVTATGTGLEILNDGTLVAANHVGQTGAGLTPVTVNGVVFGTSWAHLTSGWNTGGQWTNTDSQSLVTGLTDATDYGKLMRNYIWTGSTNTRVDIPGLVPGHTYRLQWITSSPRGGNISVEGSPSVALVPNSVPPVVLSFTWVATDSTANVLVTRQSGSYGGQDSEIVFNGYALHDLGVTIPGAVISGVTASQSVPAGAASVTLSGTVSNGGTVYPAVGEAVSITLNGVTAYAPVGSLGAFSITIPTASLAGGSYPITYSYAGNWITLAAAPSDTSTTLSVSVPAVITNVTPSPTRVVGYPTVTLTGTVSNGGTVYAAAGEIVQVTINGVTQDASITGSAGAFSLAFPIETLPVGAYPITYGYAGNGTLLTAAPANASTTLTVVATATTAYGALVQASGPVSYWPLNETSGTTAMDLVGTNHITYGGTYTLNQEPLRNTDGQPCVLFTTADAAGNTRVAYNDSLNPTQFTVECWVKPVNTTVQYLVSLQDRTTGSRTGYALWKNNGNASFGMQWTSVGTTNPSINGTTPALPGKVYHVVGTYDGTTFKLYVNGNLENSSVSTYVPASPTQPGFTIGSRNGITAAPSNIQDVALYNRALTLEEIQTHYQGSATSGYAGWATTNAGGQAANLDYNNDGVQNGIAYFMGMNGLATNPGVVGGKVTWPRVNAVASFEVQVSDNLVVWVPAAAGDVDTTTNPGQVIYTLPPGAPKKFCRLSVTP
jgi:hypothetical protein